MRNAIAMMLLMIGVVIVASAAPSVVPEMDPASAGSALALVSGGLLLFGSRRKK